MGEQISEEVCTYYVFFLDNKLYALDIFKVKEIKVGYQYLIKPITSIGSSVKGVIELGHENIPVIDLSLGLGRKELLKNSEPGAIIIAEAVLNKKKRKCIIEVDSILSITNARSRDIMSTSLYAPDIKQYFISNQFSDSKEIVNILDIDALLAKIEVLV